MIFIYQVILAFSVFMLAIAERMPETSESIPLIGQLIQQTIGEKIRNWKEHKYQTNKQRHFSNGKMRFGHRFVNEESFVQLMHKS